MSLTTIKVDRTAKGKIKSIIIKPGNTEGPLDSLVDAAIYEAAKKDAEYVSEKEVLDYLKQLKKL